MRSTNGPRSRKAEGAQKHRDTAETQRAPKLSNSAASGGAAELEQKPHPPSFRHFARLATFFRAPG